MYLGTSISAFNQIRTYEFFQQQEEAIKKEIESKGKAYILGVDESDYLAYLLDRYTLETLNIDFEIEQIHPPATKKVQKTSHWGDKYMADEYLIDISYQYSGSEVLFSMRPSEFRMATHEIFVNENNKKVSFTIQIQSQDEKEFFREKDFSKANAFFNHHNVNKEVANYNSSLPGVISMNFNSIKEKFKKENNFFEAIKVKVDQNTAQVFSVPTVKKKVVQQPKVSKDKEFNSSPAIAIQTYQDILKTIYEAGKAMEKKPSLYKEKDEEALRDIFLFHLESRYDGATATAETFNKGGKTDIIIKYAQDGTNLFVAECKIWRGAAEFSAGISQLFDRYLTWRDSKTALLVFVPNRDFTGVLQTIQVETKKHKYFMRENGAHGETSFSYVFRLSADAEKEVFFEIIVFHFDNLKS